MELNDEFLCLVDWVCDVHTVRCLAACRVPEFVCINVFFSPTTSRLRRETTQVLEHQLDPGLSTGGSQPECLFDSNPLHCQPSTHTIDRVNQFRRNTHPHYIPVPNIQLHRRTVRALQVRNRVRRQPGRHRHRSTVLKLPGELVRGLRCGLQLLEHQQRVQHLRRRRVPGQHQGLLLEAQHWQHAGQLGLQRSQAHLLRLSTGHGQSEHADDDDQFHHQHDLRGDECHAAILQSRRHGYVVVVLSDFRHACVRNRRWWWHGRVGFHHD